VRNEFSPLFESAEETQSEILENETGEKQYYLSGIYTECEKKNGNSRIYPRALVEREISERLEPKIAANTAFGEFGHPKTVSELPTIEPSRISHWILEIKQEGNVFRGKSVIVPEGLGRVAIGLLKTGGVLSVSSRGIGRVNKLSGLVEHCTMYTYDLVLNPGMKNANQTAVLENREMFVGEIGAFTEKEWRSVEKNRGKMLDAAFFRADLISALKCLAER
jgi:hypothetical protein